MQVDKRSRGKQVCTWKEAISTKRKDPLQASNLTFGSHESEAQVCVAVWASAESCLLPMSVYLCGRLWPPSPASDTPRDVHPSVATLRTQCLCHHWGCPSASTPVGRSWGQMPACAHLADHCSQEGCQSSGRALAVPICWPSTLRGRCRQSGLCQHDQPPAEPWPWPTSRPCQPAHLLNKGRSAPANIARLAYPARCN